MADAPGEKSAYMPPHARSQGSSNWRVKDESPRPEQPQQGRFRQDRDSNNNNRNYSQNNSAGNEGAVADTGCRLYVGNLLYTASREDVEGLFVAHGFNLAGISMSIDPFTQRNPSYAFVDFETPEDANRAMEVVNGKELMGREVKVNPGVRRQQGQGERRVRSFADGGSYQTDRPRKFIEIHAFRLQSLFMQLSTNTTSLTGQDNTGPAYNRWTRSDGNQHSANAQAQGLRLYVGGLPRIEPQAACEETIRQMFNFKGLEVAAVSKIISPHPSKSEEPGNHHYCFVDMNNSNDVDTAVEKLNGVETEWGALRVGRAKESQPRAQGMGYGKQKTDYERKEREGPRVEDVGAWR